MMQRVTCYKMKHFNSLEEHIGKNIANILNSTVT